MKCSGYVLQIYFSNERRSNYGSKHKSEEIISNSSSDSSCNTGYSMLLPFATVSVLGFSQSITWADGDGIFAIILAVLAAVMVFLNKNVTYIIAMVAAAINVILIIYDGFIGYASELGDYSGMVARGAGIYIFIIGAIAMVAGTVLLFVKEREQSH